MHFGKEIEYGGFPNSETRTLAQKRHDADIYAGIGRRRALVPARKNNEPEQQKVVDTTAAHEVESLKPQDEAPDTSKPISGATTMTLQFKNLSKNGKDAFYSGASRLLRFRLTDFVGGSAPESIEVGDSFVPGKAPKVKMTKEERAAERAAKPKPTEAERIAQAEERLAKRKAKLAEAQPSL